MNPITLSLRELSRVAPDVFRIGVAFTFTVAALGLSSCSTVKVKTKSDLVTKAGIDSANLLGKVGGASLSSLTAFAEGTAKLLDHARNLEHTGAGTDAAGAYLKAAVDAHRLLTSGAEAQGSEAEKALVGIHNSAMASFAKLWINDTRRHDPGPYLLTCGSEKLEIELSQGSTFQRGYFDQFIPAAAVVEEGVDSDIRFGYGAPLVAVREPRPERAKEMEFFPPGKGLYMNVTATMDSVTQPNGKDGVMSVKFSLRNPMVEQSIAIGSRQFPVAADFSAPIAIVLKGKNEGLTGLEGFFNAKQRIKHSGIFLMEPYDPNRIPVLLIHGLISVPMIWRDIVPDMAVDPEISKRYQFMVFTYPSSYPLVESAALLRDDLAALRAKYDPDGNDPLSTNMVVAGHSMGGMLTHTLVADIGDNLWNQIGDIPLDQMPIGEDKKAILRRLVRFSPDPAVKRVIYFSAPHRGAMMAEKGIAGAVSKFAQLPANVVNKDSTLLDPSIRAHLKIHLKGGLTSAQSLEPGAPMVLAMDMSPYKSGVIYHSVMGDQGKGDTPNSSDGVVDYWSSHQEGAASELIVPTGHGSYKHPKAIEELHRVLCLHAGIR